MGEIRQSQIWQSNGAIEILFSTLIRVEQQANALLAKDSSAIAWMKEFVAQHIEPLDAADFKGNLEDVLDPKLLTETNNQVVAIFNLVAGISCDIRTANLMAAIDLEATVNQFLVMHLTEPVVESVDRLSIIGKLIIAHSILGLTSFEIEEPKIQQAISALFDWRNAFAHGKLPGFKKNLSLKKLHLKTPEERGVADPQEELKEMIRLLDGYLLARKYLRRISIESTVFSSIVDLPHIELIHQRIKTIKQVKFRDWMPSDTEVRRSIFAQGATAITPADIAL